MVDHISTLRFPERLLEPVGRALRGLPAEWPAQLMAEEIAAVDAHGMVPLIYEWSRLTELRTTAIQAAAYEVLHLEAVRSVLTALSIAGVTPILLKGTALAYSLYRAPEERPRGDTDLLVRTEDVDAVRKALNSLGYTENITSGDEHGVRQASWYRTDAFGFDHSFDVHWSIANPSAFANLIRHEDALPHTVAIESIHPAARGLDRVRALLLACVHRIAHHHDSDRMIWLVDIELLARRMRAADWVALRALAVQGGVATVTAHSLAAADQCFGASHASDAAMPIVEGEPSALYLCRDARRFRFLMNEMTSLGSWSARGRRLLDLAFPPFAYMQKEFGVTSRVALPWFYAARGVRGIARMFRRVTG
jgi:hypothetical protein